METVSAPLGEVIESAGTMVMAGIPCVAIKPGGKEPVAATGGGWLIVDNESQLGKLSTAYETYGGLNLAITTGDQYRSPVVVVDVDDKDGSMAARDLGFNPSHDCWLQITGSRHYAAVYFCRDTQLLKRRVRVQSVGLDLIVAGYQLIPPSFTRGPYHWKTGHSPTDIPFSKLQELPTPMLEYWRAASTTNDGGVETRISAERLLGEVIPVGSRNDTLFRIACYLKRSHTLPALESLMSAINLTQCNPPLDLSEIKDICRSASRYSIPSSIIEVEL